MSSPALLFRPVAPTDRDELAAAFERLSPDSRYRRFLGPKKVLTPRELTYLTDVDHVTHEAIVAVDPDTREIVGVARYALDSDGRADFAVVVADAWQRQGVGFALSRRAIARAGVNGFARLGASTLWENDAARCLMSKLGFRPTGSSRGVVELELQLMPAGLRPGSVGSPRWSSVS
jgi:RimJ/RimL family protein N-acetyltransferase